MGVTSFVKGLRRLRRGLSPFITNIDASDVVFDPTNVVGGGLFVNDVDRKMIWHVTAVPEPSSIGLLVIGLGPTAGFLAVRFKRVCRLN